jgi:hypothetical protein
MVLPIKRVKSTQDVDPLFNVSPDRTHVALSDGSLALLAMLMEIYRILSVNRKLINLNIQERLMHFAVIFQYKQNQIL